MKRPIPIQAPLLLALVALLAAPFAAAAQEPPAAEPAPPASAGHDAALAERLGADQYGMRRYVLVILKNGPTPLPPGEARDAMFRGHFANMNRLAGEGRLVLAGPLDGTEGRRGIFILDAADIEEARAIVATDPVIAQGEMAADFHVYYGSAALKLVNGIHATIARESP